MLRGGLRLLLGCGAPMIVSQAFRMSRPCTPREDATSSMIRWYSRRAAARCSASVPVWRFVPMYSPLLAV